MLANTKTVTTFISSEYSIDITQYGKGLLSGIIQSQFLGLKPHHFTGIHNSIGGRFDLSFIVEWCTLYTNVRAMTAFSGSIKQKEVNKSIMLLNWLLSWENLLDDRESYVRDGTTILGSRIVGITENSFPASENYPFPTGLNDQDIRL